MLYARAASFAMVWAIVLLAFPLAVAVAQTDDAHTGTQPFVETVLRGIEYRQALVESFEGYFSWWQWLPPAVPRDEAGNSMNRYYCAFTHSSGRVDTLPLVRLNRMREQPLVDQWYYNGDTTWRYTPERGAAVFSYLPAAELQNDTEWLRVPNWLQLTASVPAGEEAPPQLDWRLLQLYKGGATVIERRAVVSLDCDGEERTVECVLISGHPPAAPDWTHRWWVAPELGFIVVKTETEWLPPGRQVLNVTSVLRVAQPAPGIWMPTRAVFIQRNRPAGDENAPWRRGLAEGFEAQSLTVNHAIPENVFTPDLLVGTEVRQNGVGHPSSYVGGDLNAAVRAVVEGPLPDWVDRVP